MGRRVSIQPALVPPMDDADEFLIIDVDEATAADNVKRITKANLLGSGAQSGFMSAADKVKLDGIAALAEVNDVNSVHGRIGNVVSAPSDYDASQIDNDSNVNESSFVDDALNKLLAASNPIAGLVPSLAADTDHDITIAAGVALANDGKILELTAAITKQIDAAWAEGNNLGGLFSGAVAADTEYHMFLIRKDSDGTIDAGFDTDLGAANIPVGWTAFKRVHSVWTDASSNLLPFVAAETAGGGLHVVWQDPPLDVDDGSHTTTAVTRTLTVPTGFPVVAIVNIFAGNATGITSLDQNDEAIQDTAAPLGNVASSLNSQRTYDQVTIRTNNSGQVRSRARNGISTLRMSTNAYFDERVA